MTRPLSKLTPPELRELWWWSDTDDAIVRQRTAEGLTAKEIAALMPGRSEQAVKKRRGALGIRSARALKISKKGQPRAHGWRSSEDDLIRLLWPQDATIIYIATLLPGRSPRAITCRASTLQIRRSKEHWDQKRSRSGKAKAAKLKGETHAPD